MQLHVMWLVHKLYELLHIFSLDHVNIFILPETDCYLTNYAQYPNKATNAQSQVAQGQIK